MSFNERQQMTMRRPFTWTTPSPLAHLAEQGCRWAGEKRDGLSKKMTLTRAHHAEQIRPLPGLCTYPSSCSCSFSLWSLHLSTSRPRPCMPKLNKQWCCVCSSCPLFSLFQVECSGSFFPCLFSLLFVLWFSKPEFWNFRLVLSWLMYFCWIHEKPWNRWTCGRVIFQILVFCC